MITQKQYIPQILKMRIRKEHLQVQKDNTLLNFTTSMDSHAIAPITTFYYSTIYAIQYSSIIIGSVLSNGIEWGGVDITEQGTKQISMI